MKLAGSVKPELEIRVVSWKGECLERNWSVQKKGSIKAEQPLGK